MENKPDLIVGVDFGMTCTGQGVAYMYLADLSAPVRYIQKWPGRRGANENKVPTVLVYEGSRLSSWGFSCEDATEQNSPGKTTREWFKTQLSPEYLQQIQMDEPETAPKSREEVKRWFKDFMSKLYGQVESQLKPLLPTSSWEDAKIEFIFSVPTTWKPYPTIEDFKIIIKQAGFGRERDHSVVIGLTEAEAAAVYTSKDQATKFQPGDVLLVCDAGGGTTDLSLLKVVGTHGEALTLTQLDVVHGADVGSAAIDADFQTFVTGILERANRTRRLPRPADEIAWEMARSRQFQNLKCEFGAPETNFPTFSIEIPKLGYDYVDRNLGISEGKLRFKKADFQKFFDRQINRMFQLIDQQLISPNAEPVSYLVLSGGLGNSDYVQARLRSRYEYREAGPQPNAVNVKLLVAPEPQLAVSKGLVVDRVQKIKSGKPVLGVRCCRSSFGMLCKEKYDKKRHIGRENITIDPLDKKMYVENTIVWFIKKNQPVSTDHPIVHNFHHKITPGDPRRVFPSTIVVSDSETPPNYLGDGDARKLCNVESDLSTADEKKFKEKNKHFWQLKQRHLVVHYLIKVLVGPADIRFQLWFDGQNFSADKPIKVEWAEVPNTPRRAMTPMMPVEMGNPQFINPDNMWKR
ncbi:MAG: hypothetical protein MMC33_003999 [Icmadophila ericetorum]|nr:hypothetical protein [Icmadophila ericetorum]